MCACLHPPRPLSVYAMTPELQGVVYEGVAIRDAEELLRSRQLVPCWVRIEGIGLFAWDGDQLTPIAREI